MSIVTNELLNVAIRSARGPDKNPIVLAETLSALRAEQPTKIKHVFKKCGLSSSSGYALSAIGRRLDAFAGVERARLEALGWAKLRLLLTGAKNPAALIDLAERCSVRELAAHLRAKGPPPDAVGLHFWLAPQEFGRAFEALVEHGAHPTLRGLRGREAALMKLIARAQAAS